MYRNTREAYKISAKVLDFFPLNRSPGYSE